VVAAYHGDSWIFWSNMKVMADDVVIYDKSFPRVVRDNNTAGVFETVDYNTSGNDDVLLRAISMAKHGTIRLSGQEKRSDRDLSSSALSRIRSTLDAYDKLLKVPPSAI
jgi:hypothetical protein